MIPWGGRILTNIAPKRPPGGLRAGLGRPLGAKADFGPILELILDPILGLKIVEIRLGFLAEFEYRFGTMFLALWRPPGALLGPIWTLFGGHFGIHFELPRAYHDFWKK